MGKVQALASLRTGAARDVDYACIVCGRPLVKAGARGPAPTLCSEDRVGPFDGLPALTCGLLARAAGASWSDKRPRALAAGCVPSRVASALTSAVASLREKVREAEAQSGANAVPGEVAPDRRR